MEFDSIVSPFGVEQPQINLPEAVVDLGRRAEIRQLSERTAARIAAGEVI
jgi:hypothetical protein